MIRLMLCSVLICTFALRSPADDKTPDKNANVKTFDVPGHGRLRLSIPAGWTSKANQPPIASLPPTIEISVESAQGQKPACQMLITPMASRTKDGNSLADLKRGADAGSNCSPAPRKARSTSESERSHRRPGITSQLPIKHRIPVNMRT